MAVVGSVFAGARGRYRLEAEIARGGFGVTFAARREEDGAAVLVKVLRLERMSSWKALDLFRREAEVLRRLSHPGIPAYLDEVVIGDAAAPEGFGLVQELVPGTNLAQRLRAGETLEREQMLVWLEQLLQILDYLHHQSPPVIHRDISPKNIVLRPDGRVVLVDFGSVQAAIRQEQPVASTAAGTFGFAPMEQFVGRATAASDLYALGMTFLCVASGRQPEEMPLDGIRVNVPALLQGDPRLIALLEAMTAPDPRQRLGDAAAALQRLAAVRGTGVPLTLEAAAGTPAGAVGNIEGYLALLQGRLVDEGFKVMRGGVVGGHPVMLLAQRRGSGLGQPPMFVYVARAHDLAVAAGDQPDPLRAFVQKAKDAHTAEGRLIPRLLRGDPVVIPVVVTEDRDQSPSLPPPGRQRGLVVMPVVTELAGGAVRIARASEDLGAGAKGWLPYVWWLAAPRLVDRPRLRPAGSLRRILAATTFAVLGLVIGLEGYWTFWGASGTYFLVYAADPSTGDLAWKSYFQRPSRAAGRVTVRDGGGGPTRRLSLPDNAFLCGLSARRLMYFTVSGGEGTTFWTVPVDGGAPRLELRTAQPNRWRSCALRDGRLAIETDEPLDTVRLQIQVGTDGAPVLVPGTLAGDHHPAWSPDGKRVVVSHHLEGRETLVAIDLLTGAREALTTPEGPQHQDIRPAFAPDGHRIAFYRSSRRSYGDKANRQTSAAFDLYVQDLETKAAHLVLQDVCFADAPEWLGPNQLAFGKWTDRDCGLQTYDLSTAEQRSLERE
jgi:hypothetical protein